MIHDFEYQLLELAIHFGFEITETSRNIKQTKWQDLSNALNQLLIFLPGTKIESLFEQTTVDDVCELISMHSETGNNIERNIELKSALKEVMPLLSKEVQVYKAIECPWFSNRYKRKNKPLWGRYALSFGIVIFTQNNLIYLYGINKGSVLHDARWNRLSTWIAKQEGPIKTTQAEILYTARYPNESPESVLQRLLDEEEKYFQPSKHAWKMISNGTALNLCSNVFNRPLSGSEMILVDAIKMRNAVENIFTCYSEDAVFYTNIDDPKICVRIGRVESITSCAKYNKKMDFFVDGLLGVVDKHKALILAFIHFGY